MKTVICHVTLYRVAGHGGEIKSCVNYSRKLTSIEVKTMSSENRGANLQNQFKKTDPVIKLAKDRQEIK